MHESAFVWVESTVTQLWNIVIPVDVCVCYVYVIQLVRLCVCGMATDVMYMPPCYACFRNVYLCKLVCTCMYS